MIHSCYIGSPNELCPASKLRNSYCKVDSWTRDKTYKYYQPTKKLIHWSHWYQRHTLAITKPNVIKLSQFEWHRNQQWILTYWTHWMTHSCYIGSPNELRLAGKLCNSYPKVDSWTRDKTYKYYQPIKKFIYWSPWYQRHTYTCH